MRYEDFEPKAKCPLCGAACTHYESLRVSIYDDHQKTGGVRFRCGLQITRTVYEEIKSGKDRRERKVVVAVTNPCSAASKSLEIEP